MDTKKWQKVITENENRIKEEMRFAISLAEKYSEDTITVKINTQGVIYVERHVGEKQKDINPEERLSLLQVCFEGLSLGKIASIIRETNYDIIIEEIKCGLAD